MSRGTRAVVAGLVGFVAYRIGVVFMPFWSAVVVGVALLAVAWLVAAPRSKTTD